MLSSIIVVLSAPTRLAASSRSSRSVKLSIKFAGVKFPLNFTSRSVVAVPTIGLDVIYDSVGVFSFMLLNVPVTVLFS
ncbi:MAG: hypothetical protein C5S38_02195 [Candidatus Methanophagaceae archaeon]|nr:MAG: hypothetical protein C5S38_02195 [Methanophagales archaeon]